ncbi:MAG: UvrB/UvrC motif-containing protein [Coprococcus sp.]
MLCDGCHENEAVICYTEIINGVKKELHLCEACAAKETGIDHTFVSLTDTSFLANLLASVLGRRQDTADDENLKKTNIVCPSCHMTYNEFLKYGTFGCPECYKTFNFLLDGYLKKIQGNCEHTGKEPVCGGETVHIPSFTSESGEDGGEAKQEETIAFTVDEGSTETELKAALKRAIAKEEYEEAARIRDIIRAGKEGAGEHA